MVTLTANDLLRALRAAGLQPHVVLIEKGGTVLQDRREDWEHGDVEVVTYERLQQLDDVVKAPKAKGWK